MNLFTISFVSARGRMGFAALAALLLATLAPAQIVITRSFVSNITIPDQTDITDTRTFDVGGGAISNVTVDVVMSGVNGQPMFNGDYFMRLNHGTGSAVLLNRTGVSNTNPFGYSDNGFAVTFSDNAANGNVHFYRNALGTAPANGLLTGVWAPDGRSNDPLAAPSGNNLATFNGLSPSGTWSLYISDQGAGGTATLQSWSLNLTVTPDGSTQLKLDSSKLANSSTSSFANPVAVTGSSEIAANSSLTLGGQLTGNGTLVKSGTNSLVLSQPDGFTGALTVTSGTVELPSGFGGAGGNVTIDAGASLIASGSISRNLITQGSISGPTVGSLVFNGSVRGAGNYTGNIVMNGAFSPGNSPAAVTVTGNLTLGAGVVTTMEIGGTTAGVNFDQLIVTGTLTFGGTLAINLIDGFAPSYGQSFKLFDAANYQSAFAVQQLPTLGNNLDWDISVLNSTGVITVSGIPEPATVALWTGGAALGCGIWWRRHRRKSSSTLADCNPPLRS